MPDIVLTTFNARYAHASFGLRYLLANLDEAMRARAAILEFNISQRATDALEMILAQNPKIVGVGVYIWNAAISEQLVRELKRVRPDITVIIGGPEVSYELDRQPIVAAADFVITGEADLAFAELCRAILSGRRPLMKVIAAELPNFDGMALPYDFYNDEDIAHRVVYVEASRGCPFKCEFCLSSLDVPVRNAPLAAFLQAMQRLLDRGVTQFKFVDRTFNLNLNFSRSILSFFLDRYRPGLFLHFEMIPDRLPEALRDLIKQFPPGALQFEVGVQTFNDDVSARISRRQDNAKLADNLAFLRNQTGVHVHADLIVGLPGEDLASFGRGFDRLVAMRPQEIQVGILKRLRGTPIVRHDAEWQMVYSPSPPYEVLSISTMSFNDLQRMRRFSRFWDLLANSGNFIETMNAICAGGSAFDAMLQLSDWLFERLRQTHNIALPRLVAFVFEYLSSQSKDSQELIAQRLWNDYSRGERREVPECLKQFIQPVSRSERLTHDPKLPARQARHVRPMVQTSSNLG